eukprot:TRINITY_DN6007_c0_g1_i1.p1 TRINITY_DN6007_c0_g1~~TRINITY_DN6007_c0_g1_i1.p1  ORF type:complete len:269 (-),score=7.32 TRINITY_DN6007_c0_g1_i1:127-933(-)
MTEKVKVGSGSISIIEVMRKIVYLITLYRHKITTNADVPPLYPLNFIHADPLPTEMRANDDDRTIIILVMDDRSIEEQWTIKQVKSVGSDAEFSNETKVSNNIELRTKLRNFVCSCVRLPAYSRFHIGKADYSMKLVKNPRSLTNFKKNSTQIELSLQNNMKISLVIEVEYNPVVSVEKRIDYLDSSYHPSVSVIHGETKDQSPPQSYIFEKLSKVFNMNSVYFLDQETLPEAVFHRSYAGNSNHDIFYEELPLYFEPTVSVANFFED